MHRRLLWFRLTAWDIVRRDVSWHDDRAKLSSASTADPLGLCTPGALPGWFRP